MNRVLKYTQLKFKFDFLMKLEILGSIPNEEQFYLESLLTFYFYFWNGEN